MKDYEHVVIWLDYFNKTLPRSKGRRIGKEMCVYDPTLKELAQAAQSAGYDVSESNEHARHPRRAHVRSGYIVLPKGTHKTEMLGKISERLVLKRSKRPKN